ncbi:hypothetical protein KPZU09_78800 [Klebsiella pneumoniae]|uniref:Tn3 transposase DDE domain-containing protein n=1 Tax=Klebsiella pneumoniae TaxID=573 RepID=A0A919I5D7_KLEPN|nr:hypothetical protein KPZU09_78800 [Klebsiella pneumoniae]
MNKTKGCLIANFATVPASELPLAVATDCNRYLNDRLTLLETQLATVNRMATANELPDAIITESGLKITPLDAAVPDTAQALIDQTAMILPHVKITELLLEVDEWTGFTRHFAHLKSGDPAKDKNLLLTTILADAISTGLTKMAESCPGTTYAKLAWLQARTSATKPRGGAGRSGQRTVPPSLRRALGRRHHLIVGRPELPHRQQGREHRPHQPEIREQPRADVLHPHF